MKRMEAPAQRAVVAGLLGVVVGVAATIAEARDVPDRATNIKVDLVREGV